MKKYCILTVLGSLVTAYVLVKCTIIVTLLASYFALIIFAVGGFFGLFALRRIARYLVGKGLSKKAFLLCAFIPQTAVCGWLLLDFFRSMKYIANDGWEELQYYLYMPIYVLMCVIMFIGVLRADLSYNKVKVDSRYIVRSIIGWSVFASMAVGVVMVELFEIVLFLSLPAPIIASAIMIKPMRKLALSLEWKHGIGNQRFCRCAFLPPPVTYTVIVLYITAIDEWGGSILFWVLGFFCAVADIILLIGVVTAPSYPMPQGVENDGAIPLSAYAYAQQNAYNAAPVQQSITPSAPTDTTNQQSSEEI